MSREHMSEGPNSPEQESNLKPFEKGNIHGMGYLIEPDRTPLAREEAEIKAAVSPFTPEHPFGTPGTLPQADIQPELEELRNKVNQERAGRETAENQARQEEGLREAAERQAGEESQNRQVAEQRAVEAIEQARSIAGQRDAVIIERDELHEQIQDIQAEQGRRERQLERNLRQEYEERENGLIDQHAEELREERQERLRIEREARRKENLLTHDLEQETDRANELGRRLEDEKDSKEQAQREAVHLNEQLKRERASRGADTTNKGSGAAEQWMSFGIFRTDMSSNQIIEEAEDRISKELVGMGNTIDASKGEGVLLARILKFQEDFENLMAFKASRGEDVSDIEEEKKRFVIRWVLGAMEKAVDKGSSDKIQEVVSAELYRNVIGMVVGSPEKGIEPAIRGVRESIVWIEGIDIDEHDLPGRVFRELPRKDLIINQIAGSLPLNQQEARLAAEITYQLYVSTGEINKFTGPIYRGVDGGGVPRFLDKEIMEEVFGSGGKINMANREYWRLRFERWNRPDLQFKGDIPYLWTRTFNTRTFLMGRKVEAQGLIPECDGYLVPATSFYKTWNLLELGREINAGVERPDGPIPAFFRWGGMVKGSDELTGKLATYLNKVLEQASAALVETKKSMGNVLKPLLEIGPNFDFTQNYETMLFAFEVKAKFLMAVLRYANTVEGQKFLKLRRGAEAAVAEAISWVTRGAIKEDWAGEVVGEFRKLGPFHMSEAVAAAQAVTFIDDRMANDLKKRLGARGIFAVGQEKVLEAGEQGKKFLEEDVSKGVR